MRSLRTGGIALALLLAALSGPVRSGGSPRRGDAGTSDGGRRAAAHPAVEAPDAGPPAPPSKSTDLCAEFNARPQLSAEEHQRRYGCPPCPCACVRGQIVCAPCAACEGSPKNDPLLEEGVAKPAPHR